MLKWLFGKFKSTDNRLIIGMTKKHYPFDGFGIKSSCNYHLFSHNEKNFLVIEQLECTTTSITNKIEEIIANICHIENLDPSNLNIFEYYPTTTLSSQYFIEIQGVKLFDGDPQWCSVKEEIRELIKAKVIPG